jgi:hypothetical protein
MRALTLREAETKRRQAIEFLWRIGNDDDAATFNDMTLATTPRIRASSSSITHRGGIRIWFAKSRA